MSDQTRRPEANATSLDSAGRRFLRISGSAVTGTLSETVRLRVGLPAPAFATIKRFQFTAPGQRWRRWRRWSVIGQLEDHHRLRHLFVVHPVQDTAYVLTVHSLGQSRSNRAEVRPRTSEVDKPVKGDSRPTFSVNVRFRLGYPQSR